MQSLDTTVSSVKGFILTSLPSTHLGWKYRFCGDDYESFQRPIYNQGLSLPGAFVDVGANVGYYVLLAKSFDLTKRIYAIEPSPVNVHCLIATIWRNNLEGCTPMLAFASDRNGFGTWSRGDESCAGMSTADREVPMIRLDDLEIPKVGFVKIDTEGSEVKVLRGFLNTIKRDHPMMMVEVCAANLAGQGSCFEELMGMLREAGYSKFDVYDYERATVVKLTGVAETLAYLRSLIHGADMHCLE